VTSPSLENQYNPADPIVDFRPAWWLRGAHRQTVWRRLFNDDSSPPYLRERVDLPDGDFIDLDWYGSSRRNSRRPLVIVLHGLEGSSRSPYVPGLLREAGRRGWDGVAMNFRSCSGEINRLPRFYHSGETGDLDYIVSSIVSGNPGRPIALAGYSLGGNVLIKWLGEGGDKIPDSIRAAVAVSVPFDLAAAAHRIDHGISRIYGGVFLRTLKKKAVVKAGMFPGLLDPKEVVRMRSFAHFDDRVTAPIHGFRNARDYWTRASAAPWLNEIRRPTLLLSACDDPFLPAACLPYDAVAGSVWLSADFTPYGGHVGFVEGMWPGAATYWVDQRVMGYLDSIIRPNVESEG
jgi:uncharacterized protein